MKILNKLFHFQERGASLKGEIVGAQYMVPGKELGFFFFLF